jgi:sensor histidine kinase YesM
MRMEDRLDVLWDIPEGLKSAEMPSMMVLSLVENAFKHGLEPQTAGGALVLRAQVTHGKLVITVKDSGVGYFPANPIDATEKSKGFGLKNIKDRLALIYGDQATFSIRALEPFEGSGTLAQISVPYKVAPIEATHAA